MILRQMLKCSQTDRQINIIDTLPGVLLHKSGQISKIHSPKHFNTMSILPAGYNLVES